MTPDTPPPDRTSWGPSPRTSRITRILAVIGVLSLLAGSTVVLKTIGVINWSIADILSDSDEAPIRVRNGSLDFVIDGSQKWEPQGSSGAWRIKGAHRHQDFFEITVVPGEGANCNALSATGSDIVLIYQNDKPNINETARIEVKAHGRRTTVNPASGVTLTSPPATPSLLRYESNGGYLKSIAIGNGPSPAPLCTFPGPQALHFMLILNQP